MKVIIDQETCIGCGLCASLAEDYFEINEEGKAEVIKQPEEETETVKAAAESCPVNAIKLENER